MAIPENYTYKDNAYWLAQSFGPYGVSDTGTASLRPKGSLGPADGEYVYRDGGYWRPSGAGPYVADEFGNFYLRA